MSSPTVPAKRKPLPISALLAIAALASGAFVVAIPAPPQPPGGFANAAQPADPGATPDAMPSLRNVAVTMSNGIGEVATAFVGRTTTSSH